MFVCIQADAKAPTYGKQLFLRLETIFQFGEMSSAKFKKNNRLWDKFGIHFFPRSSSVFDMKLIGATSLSVNAVVRLLASLDSLVSLVGRRSSAKARKVHVVTTLASILVSLIPPNNILMLTCQSLCFAIWLCSFHELKVPRTSLYAWFFVFIYIYIYNYTHTILPIFVAFLLVSQKPHEHHGHVILDSAVCKSQAGLNGTEGTR